MKISFIITNLRRSRFLVTCVFFYVDISDTPLKTIELTGCFSLKLYLQLSHDITLLYSAYYFSRGTWF